jgi:hypothetical protein
MRTFLTLRVAGFSYDEIAAEFGVSWLTIRQLVRTSRHAGDQTVTRAATRVVHRSGHVPLVTAKRLGNPIRCISRSSVSRPAVLGWQGTPPCQAAGVSSLA